MKKERLRPLPTETSGAGTHLADRQGGEGPGCPSPRGEPGHPGEGLG